MKKFMMAAALVAASVSANAQQAAGTFSLQPKVGISIANVTSMSGDAKVGLVAGVEGMYQISNQFGLSAAVMYAMQGNKYDIASKTLKNNTEYVNIPILANFYVCKGLALKAGIQPGFLTSAKLKVDDNSADAKDAYESFDFSIPVGLSYEYEGFVLDARYNWGMTKVIKDQGFFEMAGKDDPKNSVFNITIGYKFAL